MRYGQTATLIVCRSLRLHPWSSKTESSKLYDKLHPINCNGIILKPQRLIERFLHYFGAASLWFALTSVNEVACKPQWSHVAKWHLKPAWLSRVNQALKGCQGWIERLLMNLVCLPRGFVYFFVDWRKRDDSKMVSN